VPRPDAERETAALEALSPIDQLRALPYTLLSCHHPRSARVLLAEGWVEKCRNCLATRKRLDDRGGPSPFWPPVGRRETYDGCREVRTLDGVLLGRLPLTGS